MTPEAFSHGNASPALNYGRPRPPYKEVVLLWRVWSALSMYPLVLFGALYATWSAAWIILGHAPQPSLDDPKQLGLLVTVCYLVTGVLVVGVIPIGITAGAHAVNMFVISLFLKPRRPLGAVLALVVPTMFWVAGYVLLRCDPGSVLYWFMD